MSKNFLYLRNASTLWRLGPLNLLRVAVYRFLIRGGLHPVQRLQEAAIEGPFFRSCDDAPKRAPLSPDALPSRQEFPLFGWIALPLQGAPPDWLAHVLTKSRVPDPQLPWWKLPDFDARVGDIKAIWELSRGDWILPLALHARAGDSTAVPLINAWLADWCKQNPPYRGPNWKCGQEASIRALNVALAALLLGQRETPERGALEFVAGHLRRIAPTVGYAIGQDNNHGISEAAALFVGGHWLQHRGHREARRWHAMGRRLLENRVRRLVLDDGTFSQYSSSYHRLMLDALSIVEVWRRHARLPPFSDAFYAKARAATRWLLALTEPRRGDVPNLGANDGARLLALTNSGIRDFRPSSVLAAAIFENARAFEDQSYYEILLSALGIDPPAKLMPERATTIFDDGGLAVLIRNNAMATLRYPRFRFRPSHADAMHVDYWIVARNVLLDTGSFSYAGGPECTDYFTGSAGHNGVAFDDREQMIRLGRFLFGCWLKTSSVTSLRRDGALTSFGARYRDRKGASHHRLVELDADRLKVVDTIDGFRNKAVLRWHVPFQDWAVSANHVVEGGGIRIEIQAGSSIEKLEVKSAWTSRFYLRKEKCSVIEATVGEPCVITTLVFVDGSDGPPSGDR